MEVNRTEPFPSLRVPATIYFGATTFSIMTLSITTLTIMGSFSTHRINDSQPDSIMLCVMFNLLLC
jgi:hypothetical protein